MGREGEYVIREYFVETFCCFSLNSLMVYTIRQLMLSATFCRVMLFVLGCCLRTWWMMVWNIAYKHLQLCLKFMLGMYIMCV